MILHYFDNLVGIVEIMQDGLIWGCGLTSWVGIHLFLWLTDAQNGHYCGNVWWSCFHYLGRRSDTTNLFCGGMSPMDSEGGAALALRIHRRDPDQKKYYLYRASPR